MSHVLAPARIGSLVLATALSLAASAASAGQDSQQPAPGNTPALAVPGSDVVVRTWDEAQAGVPVPHYAISLDGQTFSRARQADYSIELRYASFDPLVGQPAVPPMLQADPASQLMIVQFVTRPIEAYRDALRQAGGEPLIYLAQQAHVVRLPAEARAAVESLPFVRWVGPMHTAYKLEEEILSQLAAGVSISARRYSIMLYERGEMAQGGVMAEIQRLGGAVHGNTPEGFRIEATMSLDQVVAIAKLDDVLFIDRKGDVEPDMDVVRELGGANYIANTLGFDGTGVRGEVADTEVNVNHVEWARPPIIHRPGGSSAHGTSVYGILFARGVNAQAKGLIPGGQGIFAQSSGLLGGGPTRYTHTAELVDPAGPYRAVLQTNSTGDPQTTQYTTVSSEMDDILFINDILITQSQSNTESRNSRPQAWAKNMVSVGGIRHFSDLNRLQHCWDCVSGTSASIGPATDGRIKPDLAAFYDAVFTTTANGGYTNFSGTSSATPIVAGHFGLFFQMWHEMVFPGFGGAADVFDSRPHMATAKAMLINSAFRYNWRAGGRNGDLDRNKQGWGFPDLRELHGMRHRTLIVDESDLLAGLQSQAYVYRVRNGDNVLRATMVYADLRGNVGSSRHRINDLSLKVTSPSGTVYWGNNGLTTDNVSTPGGTSNLVDTVENVFLNQPEVGQWTIEVFADEVNQDSHRETPEVDADYALVVAAVGAPPFEDGDMNCDGAIDAFDIEPFALAVFDPAGYGVQYPDCDITLADINGDGNVDAFDIEPFIDLLFGP